MATSRYDYFLPTQGIDAERGRIDLHRVFGQNGHEIFSIDSRSINGRSGLYVRASLELSNEVIARLVGKTDTHLERLRKIEPRPVTSGPSFAASSAYRTSVAANSHTAGYQTHASSVSGPANLSNYEQFSMHATASSQRRESDAGNWRGTPRYTPNRLTDAHDRPAANVYSFSASQYYRNDSPERGQDERTSSSGPRPISQNEPQDEEGDVSPDATRYNTNDVFYFPPNSVSPSEIQQRREMVRGVRGAVDR